MKKQVNPLRKIADYHKAKFISYMLKEYVQPFKGYATEANINIWVGTLSKNAKTNRAIGRAIVTLDMSGIGDHKARVLILTALKHFVWSALDAELGPDSINEAAAILTLELIQELPKNQTTPGGTQ